MLKSCPMRHAALCLMLLLSAALLGGCAQQPEERPIADVSELMFVEQMAVPEEDSAAETSENVMLYFLSADGTRLEPVARKIDVPGGVSPIRAALGALLMGPMEGEGGVWPDLGLPIVARSLEISGGVAIVDLPARVRTLPQETLFAMRAAITNTLTEFPQVQYVSVLVGGREEGFDLAATMPVGALTRTADMNIIGDYDRLEQTRQSAGSFSQDTVLYFPSADGRYVLPQVRSIDYAKMSPIEYLYTLLEEMSEPGSGELVSGSVPAPMMFIDEMPEIVRTEDGAYRAIEIRFEPALDEALLAAGLTRGVYMAMLTHTLMGAVPGVEGLKVHIGEEVLTSLSSAQTPDQRAFSFAQTLATRDDFVSYIGAPVTVYAVTGENGGLSAKRGVLEQSRQSDPRALLELLIDIWDDRAAMAGLTGDDILAVAVDGEEYALNLSAAFADALRALPEQEAKAAVYAIVNTLTQGSRMGGVSLYFEGEQLIEPIGGLEMRGRFSRNPGLVVN